MGSIVAVIAGRTYTSEHMVKVGWSYPDLGNGRFLAVDLSSKAKPKPVILELELDGDNDVVSIKQEMKTPEASVEYPWIPGFMPSKQDWQMIGIIPVGKMSLLGKGSSLVWSDFDTLKYHRNRQCNIELCLRVIQAHKRDGYKNHPKVKPDWTYPEIPDGYNIAAVRFQYGRITPSFVAFDLTMDHSHDLDAHEQMDTSGMIKYPWIDGFEPSSKDWELIGFFWGKRWDGIEIEGTPQENGWL